MVGTFKDRVRERTRATVTALPVVGTVVIEENRTGVASNWEAAEAWFLNNARREGQSPLSVRTREQRLRLFVAWAQRQQLPAGSITPQHIKQYVDGCLREGLSHFTINGRLRVLKTFFTEGIKEGIFTTNPATGMKKLRESTNTVVPLEPDAVRRLLSVFSTKDWVELRDKTIITLLLDTGLRIQEALRARVEDVHLDQGALFVPVENAKGAKARTVYFGKSTKQALQEWTLKRGVETAVLFPSVYVDASGNYECLTTRAFAKRLDKYGERAGIAHIHPHMLRHTFAINYLVHSGGDLVTCARQMGHSDMRTTERYLNVAATQAQQTLVQQHSLVDSVGVAKRSAVKRRLKG